MLVAEAVGRALAALGADTVFGVVGSGNFHATNAMVAAGARYVAARHEGGAAMMADGYARVSGRLGVLSVHQGPGLTNAMTGITEAAKSRTPLVVLAADTGAAAVRSNFRDRPGRPGHRGRARWPSGCTRPAPRSPTRSGRSGPRSSSAAPWCSTCRWTCRRSRRRSPGAGAGGPLPAPRPAAAGGGRAGRDRWTGPSGRCSWPAAAPGTAGAAVAALAERCGALLATSAVAKGLFAGDPWSLDVSGGFASPLAAELIGAADVVVAWGCALSMWTTRHGKLIGPRTTVVQVDLDPDAIGANRPVDLGVLGDVAATAADGGRGRRQAGAGYRTAELRDRIAARGPLAGRVLCGQRRRPGDGRPADAVDRAGRPAAGRAGRRGRLGQLHGLPEHVPVGPGRAGLLLHPGVPVDRARARHRDRGRAGPAGPAAGGRARRRRRADGRSASWRPRCGSGCRWSWSSTTTSATAPRCTTSARTASSWAR